MSLLIALTGRGGRSSSTPVVVDPPPPQGTAVSGIDEVLPAGDSNTANGMYVTTLDTLIDTSLFHRTYMAAQAGAEVALINSLLDYYLVLVADHTRRLVIDLKAATNNINNGKSAADTQTDLIAISDKLFEFGAHVIGSVFADPGRDSGGANTHPEYLTLKSWIQANYSSTLRWDRLHDESLDPRTEGYLPAYASYWTDSVHHSQAGADVIAQDFYDKMLDLINDPVYYPDAPTNLVIDNTAHTATFTESEGYPTASDYQLSRDGGRTVARLTSFTVPIQYTREAGLLCIRVGPKIIDGVHNNPSAWLVNGTDAIGSAGYNPSEFVAWTDQRITGTAPFNKDNVRFIYTASVGVAITFDCREGFKFDPMTDYGIFGGGVWLAEYSTNGGSSWTTIATHTAGVDNPVFDYHSGNSTPKLIRLTTQNSSGNYCIFSGITLYE